MKRVLIYGGTTEGRRLAEKLAEVKGVPVQEIVRMTEENAKRFFRII